MKKIICCILCACACTTVAGCNMPENIIKTAEPSNKEYTSVSDDDIYEFVDPDTGVHYWIYSHHGAQSGMGGMTPRLNSDGTVMVTK